MEIDFKKWFFILAVVVGLGFYVKSHYTFKDVLAYSKSHPDPAMSPKLDYYVGEAHYLRSEYPESAEAFEQLLSGYPTCQYAPKALVRLGTIYTDQRQWEKARAHLERYLEEYPNGPDNKIMQTKYDAVKFK